MDFFVEFVLEVLIEVAFSFGGEALLRGSRSATLLFLLVGGLLGFASLQLFPSLFLHSDGARLANLALSPFLVGLALGVRGTLSQKEEFDWRGFAHGFALSLGFGVTRLAFA